MLASIIIRTYNEEEYLGDLLSAIKQQIKLPNLHYEVIIVDSGSTDRTLAIASDYNCRLVSIKKEDFSYGYSLNVGCHAAKGDYLVFISGHCVPVDDFWLSNLVTPLIKGDVVLTYGRQLGGAETKFSEHQIFAKFYPPTSHIPQQGFFCNNANAALLRSIWQKYPFDECLTGLEDLYLSKHLVNIGMKLGYVAEAAVYHYHDESWSRICNRYKREAIALRLVMPDLHINWLDFIKYLVSSIWFDFFTAWQHGKLGKNCASIILFRLMQLWGSYRGIRQYPRKRLRRYKSQVNLFKRQYFRENSWIH